MDKDELLDILHEVFSDEGDSVSKVIWNSQHLPWMRRERIAIAAMQGLIAASGKAFSPDTVAKAAVEYADALNAQLEIDPPKT